MGGRGTRAGAASGALLLRGGAGGPLPPQPTACSASGKASQGRSAPLPCPALPCPHLRRLLLLLLAAAAALVAAALLLLLLALLQRRAHLALQLSLVLGAALRLVHGLRLQGAGGRAGVWG